MEISRLIAVELDAKFRSFVHAVKKFLPLTWIGEIYNLHGKV